MVTFLRDDNTRRPVRELVASLQEELATADLRREETFRRISGRVAEYERRHGLSTSEMMRLVDTGEMPETDEVLVWRMDAQLLERVSPVAQP